MRLELSPLDAEHRALGAKVVEFGGWDMPLSYPSGTIVEHEACRRDAVVFDVSHLGTVRVTGPDALERLQWALTNDLTKVAPGRAQYTHLLDELDGSVLDDIIVWWLDDETFDVMPNASNTDGSWPPSAVRRRPTPVRCSPCKAPALGNGWPRCSPRRPRSSDSTFNA
jgi:aminomethyltransferase